MNAPLTPQQQADMMLADDQMRRGRGMPESLRALQHERRRQPATDIQIIPSPMGGAWAIPRTEFGRDALQDFYMLDASPIAPLGGAKGYIVEPHDCEDLAAHLVASAVTFSTGDC